MVIDHVVGQRMDQNIQPLTMQHQPWHYRLKRVRFENGSELRYRMRADRFTPNSGDGRGTLLVGPYKLRLGALPALHFAAPPPAATVS